MAGKKKEEKEKEKREKKLQAESSRRPRERKRVFFDFFSSSSTFFKVEEGRLIFSSSPRFCSSHQPLFALFLLLLKHPKLPTPWLPT